VIAKGKKRGFPRKTDDISRTPSLLYDKISKFSCIFGRKSKKAGKIQTTRIFLEGN